MKEQTREKKVNIAVTMNENSVENQNTNSVGNENENQNTNESISENANKPNPGEKFLKNIVATLFFAIGYIYNYILLFFSLQLPNARLEFIPWVILPLITAINLLSFKFFKNLASENTEALKRAMNRSFLWWIFFFNGRMTFYATMGDWISVFQFLYYSICLSISYVILYYIIFNSQRKEQEGEEDENLEMDVEMNVENGEIKTEKDKTQGNETQTREETQTQEEKQTREEKEKLINVKHVIL